MVNPQSVVRPRLGVCFLPTSPPEALPALARAAEHHGFEELWVWEDCFKHSAIASAAIALASTERITVGIGLMPAPLRAVSLTAMELTTLARVHPGRLIGGVGHGIQSWMGQAGVRVASPMTLLSEYAPALRRLLDGDTVTVTGRYVNLDDVRLAWPADPPPPLYLGGLGPRTLRLSAELGDGVLLAGSRTPTEVGEDRRAAGLDRPDGTRASALVASEMMATGPDAAERLDAEIRSWRPDAPPGVGVAGDELAIAARLAELAAVGATTVVVQPTADEPDVTRLIEAARHARELLPAS